MEDVCKVQTLCEHLQQHLVLLDALHELVIGELTWMTQTQETLLLHAMAGRDLVEKQRC